MAEVFKRIPEPLQKQTLTCLGISALFFLILIAMLIASRDVLLWLPCAGVVICFAAAAFTLFRKAVLGDYVVICGKCVAVSLSPVKRRAKNLILQTDSGKIKIILRSRMVKVKEGAAIKLYVARNTPVYEDNDLQMLYTYIAIELK